VLELAADSREAVTGKGARSTSTIVLGIEHTHIGGRARHHQRGGQPRREERQGLAPPILDRLPPEYVRRVLAKASVPYTFEVGAPI
jgi:hypothetical protein